MISTFDDFWKFFESNEQWFEYNCKMRFFDKDPKACARDCYGYLISDMKKFEEIQKDGAALRKYFVSWLMKAPRAAVAPTLQQVEEPKPEGPPPLTGEERMKRLKEWEALVLQTPPVRVLERISAKQAAEEGGWVPKKKDAYVPIDPGMYYLKEGIAKFSGKMYKGFITFPGFSHYNFGLVTVYSDSKDNAEKILKQAQRYSRMKVLKLSR